MFEWLRKYKDAKSITAFAAVTAVLFIIACSIPGSWYWMLCIWIGFIALFYFMRNNP